MPIAGRFDIGSGPILFDVEQDVDLKDGVVMYSTGDARDILFRVAGKRIRLHKKGAYSGTFVAPRAHIDLDDRATLTGSLYGDKVHLIKDSVLNGQSAIRLFLDQFVVEESERLHPIETSRLALRTFALPAWRILASLDEYSWIGRGYHVQLHLVQPTTTSSRRMELPRFSGQLWAWDYTPIAWAISYWMGD